MDALKTLNGRPLLCVACKHFEVESESGGGCESCGWGSTVASSYCKLGHWSIENSEGPGRFATELWRAQTCPDFLAREKA